jgi:hypothetical protein
MTAALWLILQLTLTLLIPGPMLPVQVNIVLSRSTEAKADIPSVIPVLPNMDVTR